MRHIGKSMLVVSSSIGMLGLGFNANSASHEISMTEASAIYGGALAAVSRCPPYATSTCPAGACAARTVATAQSGTAGSPQGDAYCGGSSSCGFYYTFVKACVSSIGIDVVAVDSTVDVR